jgi:hypothetical protein
MKVVESLVQIGRKRKAVYGAGPDSAFAAITMSSCVACTWVSFFQLTIHRFRVPL